MRIGASTSACTRRTGARRAVLVTALLGFAAPARGRAQHEHAGAREPTEVLGIPMTRIGSGTAWLPDAAPMPGYRGRAGDWTVMAHGTAFLQYDRQFGTRGDYQVASVNWVMVGAARAVAGGVVRLRAMASAEPLTLTDRGTRSCSSPPSPTPTVSTPTTSCPRRWWRSSVASDRGSRCRCTLVRSESRRSARCSICTARRPRWIRPRRWDITRRISPTRASACHMVGILTQRAGGGLGVQRHASRQRANQFRRGAARFVRGTPEP